MAPATRPRAAAAMATERITGAPFTPPMLTATARVAPAAATAVRRPLRTTGAAVRSARAATAQPFSGPSFLEEVRGQRTENN